MHFAILTIAVVIPTIAVCVWWVFRIGPKHFHHTAYDLPVILFKNGTLEYASDAALAKFPITIGAHNWHDLYEILRPQYPEFPKEIPSSQNGRAVVHCAQGKGLHKATLQIEWRNDGASLTFFTADTSSTSHDDAKGHELLRQIGKSLPHPSWKTDHSGAVIWRNDAYRTLEFQLKKADQDSAGPVFDLPPPTPGVNTYRVQFQPTAANTTEWFDVMLSPVDGGTIYHATSRTALIRAEEAQRDFVQTLAKTFAHLSIGLAIFNRDRQLALFNPALTDLTGLSVSFLSPRPTIDTFFDALRENRRMPEPKNYKTWRQRMADLISAAEVGKFEEVWSLESGQTYNVKGRPHPDGAIAFLIEDISAEISLARNFRAELELN